MCSNDGKINTIAHYMCIWMHFQTPPHTHTHFNEACAHPYRSLCVSSVTRPRKSNG